MHLTHILMAAFYLFTAFCISAAVLTDMATEIKNAIRARKQGNKPYLDKQATAIELFILIGMLCGASLIINAYVW